MFNGRAASRRAQPFASMRRARCIYPDLDRALDMILADAQKPGGPQHLSISLGSREDLVSPDELKIQATLFLKLAALGVNTFVSSGDAGSNPDPTLGRAAVLKVTWNIMRPILGSSRWAARRFILTRCAQYGGFGGGGVRKLLLRRRLQQCRARDLGHRRVLPERASGRWPCGSTG